MKMCNAERRDRKLVYISDDLREKAVRNQIPAALFIVASIVVISF